MPEETELSIRKKGVNAFPSEGFSLIVDGKLKSHYATAESALKRASDLKAKFSALQIMVRDNSTGIRTEIKIVDKVAE